MKTFKNLEGHLIYTWHIFSWYFGYNSRLGLFTDGLIHQYIRYANECYVNEGRRERKRTSLGDSELWEPDKLN